MTGSKAKLSPQRLWRGYDPRKEPLEEDIRREWTDGGVRYKEVYFTAETYRAMPVRVYAMYAAPIGGKNLPGMLHVHGGGQTTDPAWLRFWARRGYAALSFDWGGYRPGRTMYTLWNELTQGNHLHFNDIRTTPSPKVNSWYHWTLVCRRALTYLERQAEADPRRLGAFGISMGGTLLWNLAVDRRLKAGCAIYGVGWNTFREPKYAEPPQPHTRTAQERRWLATLEPFAYAPLLRFPMLFLSATNDFHGNMDRSYDTLAAVPRGVPRCTALTPRYNHHVGTSQSRNLPLWMDRRLKGKGRWPRTPRAGIQIGRDGVPVVTVIPDDSQAVQKVEILYAIENSCPFNRHWRDAQARKDRSRNVWRAAAPVMNADKCLFAFANVHYRGGVCLSSELQAAIPSAIGPAKATDKPSVVLYDGAKGMDGWLDYSRSTEPRPPFPLYIRPATGPGGVRGIAIRSGACAFTYKLGDPKWRPPAGATLRFDLFAPERQELKVIIRKRPYQPGAKEYVAAFAVGPTKGWTTVTLKAADFRTADQTKMRSFSDANMLEVRRSAGKKEIIVSGFRWGK